MRASRPSLRQSALKPSAHRSNVTTIYPGLIESSIGGSGEEKPFRVSTEKGVLAMVRAIEREPAQANVPAWPWVAIGFALRRLPLRVIAKTVGR
jgi:hypothetical protein